MGACLGKKSSKYLNRDQLPSDIKQSPQPKIQDDISEKKSSPSPSKKLSVINDLPVNNDDESRTSKFDENSIDSELQIILDEQKIINDAFSQPFPSRIISFTDTELEYELANLMFNPPENDPVQNSLTVSTDKSKDAS